MTVLVMCWHGSGSLKERAAGLTVVTCGKIVRPVQLIIISHSIPRSVYPTRRSVSHVIYK